MIPGPGLPDRRHHLRPAGHPRRLPHRPGPGHPPRPGRHRRGRQRQPDRHPRGALSGDAQQAGRGDRPSWSRTSASRASARSGMNRSERNGEPVELVVYLKRDADPQLILNQLYQFSPLQKTVSIILLALVDGQPRVADHEGDAAGLPPASGAGDPPADRVPAARGQAAQRTSWKGSSSPSRRWTR